MTINNAGWL